MTASLAAADPAARVRDVREFVLDARGRAGPDPAGALGPLRTALRLPGPSGPVPDVQVGSLPGVGHAVHLAGSRITRMVPFGPLGGSAATLTALTHEDTACVGITLDAAAVTAPAVLVAALEAALAEIVALGG
jgi:hypothetical protein